MKNKSVLFMAMLAVSGFSIFAGDEQKSSEGDGHNYVGGSSFADAAPGAAELAAQKAAAAELAAQKAAAAAADKPTAFASRFADLQDRLAAVPVVLSPLAALYLLFTGVPTVWKAGRKIMNCECPFEKTGCSADIKFSLRGGSDFIAFGYRIQTPTPVLAAAAACAYLWTPTVREAGIKGMKKLVTTRAFAHWKNAFNTVAGKIIFGS